MSFHISIVPEERRKAPRERCAERGIAITENARRGCEVTEISSKGARLVFSASGPLPLRFNLVLADGRQVQCQRIWQDGTSAGVQFERDSLWKRLFGPRERRR